MALAAYIVHTTTGPVRVLSGSREQARMTIAELEPDATILRIERETEW